MLGDDEGTGRLAGTFNAIGSFPLDSVLLPGAPFAQTRVFETDIAVTPQVAGFLTLANAVSYRRAELAFDEAPDEADRLEQTFRERLHLATGHFSRADAWIRSLDETTRTAYQRLTAPPNGFAEASGRMRFVCESDADLAVLAARLGLVRSEKDGSRLADRQRCGS
jgi:hypothetical protein